MKTLTFAALTILLFICFTAQTKAAAASQTSGYSEAQVDGITSAVVDRLWARTDYWWALGEYTRIIADERIITEADPGFLEPYATGGWLYESMGDNANAEKYYLLGAHRNPQASFAWFNLGFFYYNTMKEYPKAVNAFSLAAHAPDAGINDWKMLAHSYERNNQIASAITVWKMLNKTYPNNGPIVHNLDEDQQRLVAAAITTAGQ